MGQGPLSGLKIVEFAGIGRVPFAGMLLSDLKPTWCASILGRARRLTDLGDQRGRKSVALDLKSPPPSRPA